jgi:hypothetical protein
MNTTATRVGDNIVFSGNCTVTGQPYQVTVPADAVAAWWQGVFIQDAMPGVSPGDREFLVSGISPAGWDRIFQENGGEGVG